MKMVNLFNEVEMISRTSQAVLLGGGGTSGGSTGGSGEEEDPPWIYPNSITPDLYSPESGG
jgi:hypothetical protein